jgi:hypothetical protein
MPNPPQTPKLPLPPQSKLDWDRYKAAAGLEAELAASLKDKRSFVERRRFLDRADQREFEVERGERERRRRAN